MVAVAELIGGLDVIINRIRSEAESAADDIKNEAHAKAESVIDRANKEAAKITAEAREKAEKYYKTGCERERNGAERLKNQEILAKRQEVLDASIENAVEKLKNSKPDYYFEIISKLLNKFGKNAEGVIMFSSADLERMPETFKRELKDAFPKLKAESSNSVDYGFIIKYGEIEENCTFDALIEANCDSIKEKVFKRLFS